jgi:hypothetical protein
MTNAEWAKIYAGYKSVSTAPASGARPAYRYRSVLHRGILQPVFLTDQKRVDIP